MNALARTDRSRSADDLTGRRALVTGAGRGIGLAIAQDLAAAGAHVVFCARSADEIDKAVQYVRDLGHSGEALGMDVTDTNTVQQHISAHAPFDILVNNAGTNRPKPLGEITEEDYDRVMDLNLRSVVFLTQAVTGRMIEAGVKGSVINMSSQMGHTGAANRTIYCASKWALEGFTKSLAVELGLHGIRVNTVCPTFVETPLTKPFFENPEFKAAVLSKIVLGRLGTVDDIVGAVRFLASDASSLMTGSAMKLDGGWTAH